MLVSLFMGIFCYGSYALAATLMTPTPITAQTTAISKTSNLYVYANASDNDTCYVVLSSNGIGGNTTAVSCVKTTGPAQANLTTPADR